MMHGEEARHAEESWRVQSRRMLGTLQIYNITIYATQLHPTLLWHPHLAFSTHFFLFYYYLFIWYLYYFCFCFYFMFFLNIIVLLLNMHIWYSHPFYFLSISQEFSCLDIVSCYIPSFVSLYFCFYLFVLVHHLLIKLWVFFLLNKWVEFGIKVCSFSTLR